MVSTQLGLVVLSSDILSSEYLLSSSYSMCDYECGHELSTADNDFAAI